MRFPWIWPQNANVVLAGVVVLALLSCKRQVTESQLAEMQMGQKLIVFRLHKDLFETSALDGMSTKEKFGLYLEKRRKADFLISAINQAIEASGRSYQIDVRFRLVGGSSLALSLLKATLFLPGLEEESLRLGKDTYDAEVNFVRGSTWDWWINDQLPPELPKRPVHVFDKDRLAADQQALDEKKALFARNIAFQRSPGFLGGAVDSPSNASEIVAYYLKPQLAEALRAGAGSRRPEAADAPFTRDVLDGPTVIPAEILASFILRGFESDPQAVIAAGLKLAHYIDELPFLSK